MKRSVVYSKERDSVEMKVYLDDSHIYCHIYGVWGGAIFESNNPYFFFNGKQVFLTECEKLIAEGLSLKTQMAKYALGVDRQGTLLEALDMDFALD